MMLFDALRRCAVSWLAVVLFMAAVAAPRSASASSHEDFAMDEIRRRYTARIEALESSPTLTPQQRDELSYEVFDAKERLTEIARVAGLGQSFSNAMREFLTAQYLPRLEALARKHGFAPDAAVYTAARTESARRVAAADADLAAWYKGVAEAHPKLRRIIQFLAFARSETLASGTIGDWNPAAADAIQESTVRGLTEVLEFVEGRTIRDGRLTIETLQELHKKLLGKAEHHFSVGGRINDIYFTDGAGRRVHVLEFLKAWEAEIAARKPGLATASWAYQRFLHLHPFGDSNGRVAELVKQIILDRAGLPPLLTREKSAAENYLFQEIFGSGDIAREHLAEAQETRRYVESWLGVLEGGWSIREVRLAGGNVVVDMTKGGERRVVVSTRVYEVPRGSPLPPIKGSMVLAEGVRAESASMRVTRDGWQTHEDVRPTAVTATERLGAVGMRYAFFAVDVPPAGAGRVELAFHYQHPNGQTVWFNNDSRNYAAWYGTPTPCQRLGGS